MDTASPPAGFGVFRQKYRHALPLMRTKRLASPHNDIGWIDDIGSIDDFDDIGGNDQLDAAGGHWVEDDKHLPAKTVSPGPAYAKGTTECIDANAVARILRLSCYQVQAADTNPGRHGNAGVSDNVSRTDQRAATRKICVHPMAVTHTGHLVRHFGIQLVFLFGAQVWAAWSVSSFADEYLAGGRPLHLVIVLSLLMVCDVWVWLTHRGKTSEKFQMPGAVLFVTAVLPIAVLHLRQVLCSAE